MAIMLGMSPAQADERYGQTVQINTHFKKVYGNPSWLLIIRDMDNGRVFPYMFDIKNTENFWVAFSHSRSYRITTSTLDFGPFAVIHNFCHLENGVYEGQSLFVTLSGTLSPVPGSFNCRIMKYNDIPFSIAK